LNRDLLAHHCASELRHGELQGEKGDRWKFERCTPQESTTQQPRTPSCFDRAAGNATPPTPGLMSASSARSGRPAASLTPPHGLRVRVPMREAEAELPDDRSRSLPEDSRSKSRGNALRAPPRRSGRVAALENEKAATAGAEEPPSPSISGLTSGPDDAFELPPCIRLNIPAGVHPGSPRRRAPPLCFVSDSDKSGIRGPRSRPSAHPRSMAWGLGQAPRLRPPSGLLRSPAARRNTYRGAGLRPLHHACELMKSSAIRKCRAREAAMPWWRSASSLHRGTPAEALPCKSEPVEVAAGPVPLSQGAGLEALQLSEPAQAEESLQVSNSLAVAERLLAERDFVEVRNASLKARAVSMGAFCVEIRSRSSSPESDAEDDDVDAEGPDAEDAQAPLRVPFDLKGTKLGLKVRALSAPLLKA
jgi:hypothetical protein